MNSIRKDLKLYIENQILPEYIKNDIGHGIEHIKYVVNRSIKFANQIKNINFEMVYVIAAYHDIGHHINPKLHEIVSSEILLNDKTLKKYFDESKLIVMSEAIIDHRASYNTIPRSIYGKIISSADRTTDINKILKRAYEYRLKNGKTNDLTNIIDESYKHIKEKYGNNGYAKEKMYFIDKAYDNFLKEINCLLSNKEEFKKIFCEINNIKKKELNCF